MDLYFWDVNQNMVQEVWVYVDNTATVVLIHPSEDLFLEQIKKITFFKTIRNLKMYAKQINPEGQKLRETVLLKPERDRIDGSIQ